MRKVRLREVKCFLQGYRAGRVVTQSCLSLKIWALPMAPQDLFILIQFIQHGWALTYYPCSALWTENSLMGETDTEVGSHSVIADACLWELIKLWGAVQFVLLYIFLKAILNPFRKRQGRDWLTDQGYNQWINKGQLENGRERLIPIQRSRKVF